jgi:hypothetical protein
MAETSRNVYFAIDNVEIIICARSKWPKTHHMMTRSQYLLFIYLFLNLPNPSGRTRPWGLLSL